MSDKYTGGPAFPCSMDGPCEHFGLKPKEGQKAQFTGMTLRDYFAAKALPGLMGRDWSHHKGTDLELLGIWARSSFAIADEMIEARK